MVDCGTDSRWVYWSSLLVQQRTVLVPSIDGTRKFVAPVVEMYDTTFGERTELGANRLTYVIDDAM